MATVSATQQIRTITPPSSSHGARNGSWDYENQQSSYADEKSYKPNPNDTRQPLSQSTNGNRKMSYGSDTNVQRSNYGAESEYSGPRKNNLNHKKSGIRRDSESDASLDVYKTTSASRSTSNGIDKGGRRKPSNAKLRSPEEDDDNWIHRDKLAQIESREMEEAGFPAVRPSRAGSRSTAGGSYSRQDQHTDLDTDGEYDDYKAPKAHEIKRQRIVSPIPAEEEEENAFNFELRTPEEVAAEQDARQYFRSPPVKPNSTRIPIPKQSPVPVPSIIMERDSPLPRSRTSSGNGIPEIRPRSRSMSSQVLLDDEMPRTPLEARRASASDDSPSSSDPRYKGQGKGGLTSGGPKSSTRTASGNSKYRASSQQNRGSPEKRPGTSSGRPSTSHRPEGDPPWLATMYKPDPRLPPDQQMLPTHAKRLAQEKWAKEGKTGTVYDREFRLLNTEEIERPLGLDFSSDQDVPKEKKKPASIQTGNKWPLGSPLGSPISQQSRPGTSGTEHGGYTTMPKITSPPAATTPTTTEKPKEPIRLPEPQEEEEREKKGCCCIVM